jgi:hypothetical protein
MSKRALSPLPFLVAALAVISSALWPAVGRAQYFGAGSSLVGYRSSVGHYHGAYGADKGSYRKSSRKPKRSHKKVTPARTRSARQASRPTPPTRPRDRR